MDGAQDLCSLSRVGARALLRSNPVCYNVAIPEDPDVYRAGVAASYDLTGTAVDLT